MAMASTGVTATRTAVAIASMETQITGLGRSLAASLHHSVVRHHGFDSEAGVAAGPFAAVALRPSVAHHHFKGGLPLHSILVVVHHTPSGLDVSFLDPPTSRGNAIGVTTVNSAHRRATSTAPTALSRSVVHPLKSEAPSRLHSRSLKTI